MGNFGRIYDRTWWGDGVVNNVFWGMVYATLSKISRIMSGILNRGTNENRVGTEDIINNLFTDKSKLDKITVLLTPTSYSVGSLNCAIPINPTYATFSVTGGTPRTRINEQGLVEDVAANVPSINYPNGYAELVLSPTARTNTCLYSEDLTDTVWTKTLSTVTNVSETNPRGNTANVSKIDFNASAGAYVRQVLSGHPSAKSMVVSCWVKSPDGNNQNISIGLGTTSNITNVTATAQWQRVQFSIVGVSSPVFYINGNGASVLVWGCQAESHYYGRLPQMSSYIPTTSTSQTRTATKAQNAGDSTMFSKDEGVLYFEGSAQENAPTSRFISISAGNTSNRACIIFSSTSQTITAIYRQGASDKATLSQVVSDVTDNVKIAFKYKSGDFALWINGTEVATSTATFTAFSDFTELSFDQGVDSGWFEGNVRCVATFKEILTDDELQDLTT